MKGTARMNEARSAIAAAIAGRLAACSEVAAIAVGGSIAAETSDERSDLDVYIFTDGDVPTDIRTELAERFDPAPEIDNGYFGPTDEWADEASGVGVDLTYWNRRWFEDELVRVIDRHQPSLGYTTAFWYTTRHAIPLFDRLGWLEAMRKKAATPYPGSLRERIIAFNHPMLRMARSSYCHQIELAVARNDPVSVNHRIAAFLASLFDIVFAANLALHPGEKRLLTYASALPSLPDEFVSRVRILLAAPAGDVLPALDALCGALDAWLRVSGCLPVWPTKAGGRSPSR